MTRRPFSLEWLIAVLLGGAVVLALSAGLAWLVLA